jgi:hypothetical protein
MAEHIDESARGYQGIFASSAAQQAVPCQISLPAIVVLTWPGLFAWQWGWHGMCG